MNETTSKPKVMMIEIVKNAQGEEMLSVIESDNTPYSAPFNRTGYYNMTFAYWLKNEFPVWSETAHIHFHPGEDDSIKLS